MKFALLQPKAGWKTALGFQSRRKIRPAGSFRLILGLRIHAGRVYIRSTRDPTMSSSVPTPATTVSEVLKQAAATLYCRPALRALGDAMPADDSILHNALDHTAMTPDAEIVKPKSRIGALKERPSQQV